MPSRVSLAPPPSETDIEKAQDKWADPAMPESSHLLLPHTQQLLRIARSGKYGTKRKTAPDVEPDGDDFNAREEEGVPEELLAKPVHVEEKGFLARKWRQVPEAALVPEHLHWEFLAKRRKGLPSYYHGGAADPSVAGLPQAARRKTRVQRVLDAATGESAIYEVVALEGQVLENELPADSQMQPTHLEPGTTIEGLGTADEDGLISLVPSSGVAPSRRNRPPPKKKGGPGRGKKRVTFTNPDGSTYTTIVPNATKIVPQPGQTVKHVAKGEDAGKDVSMEEAARIAHEAGEGGENDDEGDDDEEGDEGDEEDDDREDGEIQEDDAEVSATPAKRTPPAEAKVETAPETIVDAPIQPTPLEPVSAEATAAEDTTTAQISDEPKPDGNLEAEHSLAQQSLAEMKPDLDVEMEDRPAEIEPAVTEIPETEVKVETQPELAPAPDQTVSEAAPLSPSRPEPQAEDPHVEDAMDTDPVEAPAVVDAVPSAATAPAEAAPEETKPTSSPAEIEQPAPVAEIQQPVEPVENVPQPVEQVLEVEVPLEAPENEAIGKDSEVPEVEAALASSKVPDVPETAAQSQDVIEPPVEEPAQEQQPPKAAESGEEDLLGSLERSLET